MCTVLIDAAVRPVCLCAMHAHARAGRMEDPRAPADRCLDDATVPAGSARSELSTTLIEAPAPIRIGAD